VCEIRVKDGLNPECSYIHMTVMAQREGCEPPAANYAPAVVGTAPLVRSGATQLGLLLHWKSERIIGDQEVKAARRRCSAARSK